MNNLKIWSGSMLMMISGILIGQDRGFWFMIPLSIGYLLITVNVSKLENLLEKRGKK